MIKNLLFDLGGVIMDIERRNCVDAFVRLGLQNADSFFGDYGQSGVFEAIEEGSISVDEFHRELRKALPEGVSDKQIDDAFECFLTGIPQHRLEALRQLRSEGYRIYLLSNTNKIMWDSKIKREFEKEGLTREDYFDGIVTSFCAHALKPRPEIFRYTAETLGIKPEETLFFDDSQKNVEAAIALGFKGEVVAPGTEFISYIKEK